MLELSSILILVVALLHIAFMALETFLWRSAYVASAFKMTPATVDATAPLAANQGIYNLFLASGLVFALAQRGADIYVAMTSFFLVCVIVAGIFGSLTVSARIFFIQAVPAIAAMTALWAGL